MTLYQHAESLKYYALARMEVSGGLLPYDRDFLVARLTELGADPATIEITGDLLEEGEEPVAWPGEVNLRIEFVPAHFDSFASRVILGQDLGEPVRIGVEGSAVSQKVVP